LALEERVGRSGCKGSTNEVIDYLAASGRNGGLKRRGATSERPRAVPLSPIIKYGELRRILLERRVFLTLRISFDVSIVIETSRHRTKNTV
jgi:hypothetical protein